MTKPKYVLLDERTGWPGDFQDSEIDACAGGLRLAYLPGAQIPLTDPAGSFGGLTLPLSLALDSEDRLYLLDGATQHIRLFNFCTREFATLPCIGGIGEAPRHFQDARSITISAAGDLYVADTGNRRVQVFTLNGLALRHIFGPLALKRTTSGFECKDIVPTNPVLDCTPTRTWPEQTWEPVDVLVDDRCRVLVADPANDVIHVFNRAGVWITAWTGAGEGFDGLRKPLRLARDCSGRLYVVQSGSADVIVLDSNGSFVETISANLQVSGKFCPAAIGFDQDGRLVLTSSIESAVNVVCRDGGGRRIEYRFSSGPAVDVVFDKSGNAILATSGPKKVVQVPLKAVYASSGTYVSAALDSRIYRCKWHRILLNAVVPLGTRVTIDTFTAESEKSMADVLALPEERWSTHQQLSAHSGGVWDALLDAPEGRYLWLRLTLEGEGQNTPVIDNAALEYPRITSRKFLPATYSDDPVGREFLDHFLAVTDTLRNRTWNQLANLHRYFDPMATPADESGGSHDFLSWLASWLGLALEQRWPLEKRRKLVAAAHLLYKLRGTPEGLRQHILLYAGSEPGILEHFRLRRWLTVGETRLGGATELWSHRIVNRLQLDSTNQLNSSQLIDVNDPLRDPFHARAHRFTVFVPSPDSWGDDEKALLQRIVDNAKPAHTLGDVKLLRPRFRIGVQSFVGMDTVIGRYPDHTGAGRSKLGYDSVLSARRKSTTQAGGIRIGASTTLT